VLNSILFADDTNLFYSSKSISELQQVLNNEMAALPEWFKANTLLLNTEETFYSVPVMLGVSLGQHLSRLLNLLRLNV